MKLRYPLGTAAVALGLALSTLPATAAENPRAQRAFDRLDSNHDGKVDAAEMEAMRAARFKRLDVNGDGVISNSEQNRAESRIRRRAALLEARIARQFEQMDTDRDLAVSEDEFVGAPPLARADANQDGAVTRAEFDAAIAAVRERPPRRR